MTAAQQQLEQNTDQLAGAGPRDVEQNSSQISQEEEIKVEDDSDVNDEELGSELSGMSVEIPEEVEDITRSANYLSNYDRDYKSGVLQKIKQKERSGHNVAQIRRYVFPSNDLNNEENKEESKERN